MNIRHSYRPEIHVRLLLNKPHRKYPDDSKTLNKSIGHE